MKINQTPDKIQTGICFICKSNKDLDPLAYCHTECALALAEEKDRRNKEFYNEK